MYQSESGELQTDKSNSEIYNEIVQDVIQHISKMMQNTTLNNIAGDPKNESIKRYSPSGKDLVLSDFTDSLDFEYYIQVTRLHSLLVHMQKRYYQLTTGIMPVVEIYTKDISYFSIGTRAKGQYRERMLQANPNHRLNLTKEPNALEKTFGIKQQ